jgi:ADP-heptose:LPS heptosyltransferase
MKKILVIRFSALGDVAMTIPVLASFARTYPEHQIVFLSRQSKKSLFENIAPNIRFYGADFNHKHKGIKGLWLLYRKLSESNFDHIVDLHGVLRSHIIRILFFLSGTPVSLIRKGRFEKFLLTGKYYRKLIPLRSSFERYRQVFLRAGFSFEADKSFSLKLKTPENHVNKTDNQLVYKIGVAPFARHTGKIYPHEKMTELLRQLSVMKQVQVYLFGGGKEEIRKMQAWTDEMPVLHIFAGRSDLKEEIAAMQDMNVMLTMDSANMHLASLAGTRVVSLWGATHPYAGFTGWNQSASDIIQLELPCRPCSVYGNKPCYRKDYACMNGIEPQTIIDKLFEGYEDRI